MNVKDDTATVEPSKGTIKRAIAALERERRAYAFDASICEMLGEGKYIAGRRAKEKYDRCLKAINELEAWLECETKRLGR